MRRAGCAVVCSSLVVLLAWAATWPGSDARHIYLAPAPAPGSSSPLVAMQAGMPWPWNHVLPRLGESDVVACWKTLLHTRSCVVDLFRFFFDRRLSPACCSAIHELRHNCASTMFEVPPFGDWFPPMVMEACSVPAPTPAPAPAPAPISYY